jgi:hypothetical protein
VVYRATELAKIKDTANYHPCSHGPIYGWYSSMMDRNPRTGLVL